MGIANIRGNMLNMSTQRGKFLFYENQTSHSSFPPLTGQYRGQGGGLHFIYLFILFISPPSTPSPLN